MKITSIDEFVAILTAHKGNHTFYRASKKFGMVEPFTVKEGETTIRFAVGGHAFIGHEMSFLDMNIPVNTYNDWYLFSNEEEATTHAKPCSFSFEVHKTVQLDHEAVLQYKRVYETEGKIPAIKLIRNNANAGLGEAKNAIEDMAAKYNWAKPFIKQTW